MIWMKPSPLSEWEKPRSLSIMTSSRPPTRPELQNRTTTKTYLPIGPASVRVTLSWLDPTTVRILHPKCALIQATK